MRMYEGKVTFAVVGLGGRASAYLAALREFYPDGHAVVAVADPDPKNACARRGNTLCQRVGCLKPIWN